MKDNRCGERGRGDDGVRGRTGKGVMRWVKEKYCHHEEPITEIAGRVASVTQWGLK